MTKALNFKFTFNVKVRRFQVFVIKHENRHCYVEAICSMARLVRHKENMLWAFLSLNSGTDYLRCVIGNQNQVAQIEPCCSRGILMMP